MWSCLVRNRVKRVFLRQDCKSALGNGRLGQTASRWQGDKSSCQFLCWYISQRGHSSRQHIIASKVCLCARRLTPTPCHRDGRKRLKDQWHSSDVKYSRAENMAGKTTCLLVSNYSTFSPNTLWRILNCFRSFDSSQLIWLLIEFFFLIA